jgi:hypothetical protein
MLVGAADQVRGEQGGTGVDGPPVQTGIDRSALQRPAGFVGTARPAAVRRSTPVLS